MSKLQSESDLQDFLDRELSWRQKEIQNIRLVVRSYGGLARKTFLRAGVVLLYAHWEGFVKTGTAAYVSHVASRGLPTNSLRTCFNALAFKTELNHLTGGIQHSSAAVAAVEAIELAQSQPVRLSTKEAVAIRDNLGSETFMDIMGWIGMDVAPYRSRMALVNQRLVHPRNRVAHGEHHQLEEREFVDVAKQVMDMLRQFKSDIESASATRAYER